jgi:alkanesulfonate monooxygenase SsuD/methylene tetrahydromethanopterin reductase-like flavin-dependent oxidoreductase (luciferase family)
MHIGVTCGVDFWGAEMFAAVEALGFDGIYCGEHLVNHYPVWDAVTMCTAIACATTKVTLGPLATIAPLRHPTLLAKEMTGIDIISGGRLVVGLGVGGDAPVEFHANGVPLTRLGRRTTETAEIMRLYFSGETFSYAGEIYALDDVRIQPPPTRPGGPPLWIAGRRAPTQRRAALVGDGFVPYMFTPDQCAEAFASVRGHADAAGRVLALDYTWGILLPLALAENADEARRRLDESMAWRYEEPRFLGDLSGRYSVAGDAAACIEGLLAYVEAGCNHIVLQVLPREGESELAALEALAGDVLPALRRAS